MYNNLHYSELISDGSIYYDENLKKYRIQFYYIDIDGVKRRKSLSGKSKREVQQKRNEFLEKLFLERSNRETKKRTLTYILQNDAKNDFELNVTGESAYRRRLYSIRKIEKSAIGDLPVNAINDDMIAEFLSSCTKYSNSYIRKIYEELNKGFEIAIEEELIIKNPMKKRKARKPQSVKSDKKVTSLTVSEESQLVNYLLYDYEPRPNRYNIKYQLLIELFSGLRMGEINALTRSDIDFTNSVITVNKTITNTRDDKPKIGKKPKTYCGNREVPISKKLEPILKEAVQCSKGNPNGLLFYNKVNKTLVTTSQVNLAFKTICKNAGINKPDVNQHMLRHTFTTRCVEAHIPPEVLKSWLGHSSVDITIDIYTDIQKNFENSEVKKLDDYLDNHICN